LGLAYVAASLEQHGHKVRVLDWSVEPSPPLKERVTEVGRLGPDLVGVTALTGSYFAAQEIVAKIKERIDCPVVLGGAHATLSPRLTLLENPKLDFVISGDGTEAFVELLAALEQPGPNLGTIAGLTFRHKGDVVQNGRAAQSLDPDALFPAFHLFQPGRYDYTGLDGVPMLPLLIGWEDGRKGGHWRRRSVKSIVTELRYNHARYNARAALFVGQPFKAADPWARQLTEALTNGHLETQWRCQADAAHVTPRLLGEMRHAGCRQMDFYFRFDGVALNEAYLERLRKNVAWTAKLDIKAEGHLEIGRPDDDEEMIRKLIAFVADLDLAKVNLRAYCPTPSPHEWPLVEQRYMASRQTGSIYQAYYESVSSHSVCPSWLNVSDVPHARLIELAREGRWLVSETRRRRKYELYFGKGLGTFLWHLSQQQRFRSLGRRIVDLGLFRGLRTAILEEGEKQGLPPSSRDTRGLSAPAN
jgi:hypothetical protein